MYPLLFKTALSIYGLSTLGYLVSLLLQRRWLVQLSTAVLILALLLHAGSFAARYAETGSPPLLGIYDTLSFLAWIIAAAYLALQLVTQTQFLGAFVSPLALLLLLLASPGTIARVSVAPILRGSLVVVHAALTVAGEGLFLLASLAGAIYLVQDSLLKRRKHGPFSSLFPSLQDLDRCNHVCLLWGFPLLTLGTLAGAVWARVVWGSHWQWDPTQTWTLLVWLSYAALLHQRLAIGWRGHKAAVYSLAALVVLLLSLVVCRSVLPSAHSFT